MIHLTRSQRDESLSVSLKEKANYLLRPNAQALELDLVNITSEVTGHAVSQPLTFGAIHVLATKGSLKKSVVTLTMPTRRTE